MNLENIDKYLQATSKYLGVQDERYGGGYRAILGQIDNVAFLFEKLDGDDTEGTQAQQFFWDNPLFPSAHGATPSDALRKLDQKLGILYRFETADGRKWTATPTFRLVAQHDCDPGEDQTYYEVSWDDIVADLQTSNPYFYEEAKNSSSPTQRRDLHALVNFRYEGELVSLKEQG